jgi:hypothetical protein
MKWVKFKHQFNDTKISKWSEDQQKTIFKIYERESQETFEQELDNYDSKFHKWGYEVVLSKSDVSDDKKKLLESYELYAGGWLDFWDTVVRQDSTNHALYFRKRDCGDKIFFTAYISNLNSPVKTVNKYISIVNPPASTDPPPPPPNKPPY